MTDTCWEILILKFTICESNMTIENSSNNYYKIVQRHRQECFYRPALQAVYKHWASIRQQLLQTEGKSKLMKMKGKLLRPFGRFLEIRMLMVMQKGRR